MEVQKPATSYSRPSLLDDWLEILEFRTAKGGVSLRFSETHGARMVEMAASNLGPAERRLIARANHLLMARLSRLSPQELRDFVIDKFQIWTGEMGSNILNKGDFYGIGMMGNTVMGFIDAGVDGFKYKGDAIDYTAGATVDCTIGSNWTHVGMTYDNSALNLYINGDLEDSAAFNQAINTNDFELVIGDDFNGMIDEVHVLDTAESGDWKKTCANNELAPPAFYGLGSEETAPIPVPVGGEAYSINGISVLAPWIGSVALLACGATWLALRRRRARS